MNAATIGAFFLGLQRLAAMGAAVWFYREHDMTLTLVFAGYATGTQLWDTLKVNKQVEDAKTTTSVTVQQPADAPPLVLSPDVLKAAPSKESTRP
jgi:hypothetical protein